MKYIVYAAQITGRVVKYLETAYFNEAIECAGRLRAAGYTSVRIERGAK